VAGTVTVCLASHWPCITGSVLYPPTISVARESEMRTAPTLLWVLRHLYLYVSDLMVCLKVVWWRTVHYGYSTPSVISLLIGWRNRFTSSRLVPWRYSTPTPYHHQLSLRSSLVSLACCQRRHLPTASHCCVPLSLHTRTLNRTRRCWSSVLICCQHTQLNYALTTLAMRYDHRATTNRKCCGNRHCEFLATLSHNSKRFITF